MMGRLYIAGVVGLYLLLALTGWEPFSGYERGQAPHGPGGIHGWTSGFMGGK